MTKLSLNVFAVITGGGTSGHVIPALAIAELLQDAGYLTEELHFVGTTQGVETSLVPPTGIALSLLSVRGLSRKISIKSIKANFKSLSLVRIATKQAEVLLKNLKPKVVVSVGGYASVPTTRAAKHLRIPVVAVSYDRQPGLATRLQARFATATAVAHLPTSLKNATLTGAPVRRVLRNLDVVATREVARANLNLPLDRKVICITGGSLGSAKLNSVAREIAEMNQNRTDLCIIHLTGQRYINDNLPNLNTDAKIVYRRLESTVAMQDVYSASDLVVARAGASTVAEIATIGLASVLVPWSGAAEDHQVLNAKTLGDTHGAVVMNENVDSVQTIATQVVSLVDDKHQLDILASVARGVGEQHRNSGLAKLIISAAAVSRIALDVSTKKRIHIVGVGGPGMSAIATVLVEMGHEISGSDIHESPVIDRLREIGIKINISHLRSVVEGCDFVTGSPAIPASNVEYQQARDSGIRVASRAETLASICAQAKSIGVAGTHGKTTTSSMLTTIMKSASKDPSYLIGGDVMAFNRGASWTNGEFFVVEADESDGTHLQLPLFGAILTNVDVDHLDHFKTQSAIEQSFVDFVSQVQGPRILCLDDPVCAQISGSHACITYSVNQDACADYLATDIKFSNGESRFTVIRNLNSKKIVLGTVVLPQRGLHNVSNALGAIAMAMQLDTTFEQAAGALGDFGGVARRFDNRGSDSGVTFVDDYAHLPGEISAVLSGARDETDSWSRIIAVFQPNRFNRMSQISDLYADSFIAADIAIITDIYSSGTEPIVGVTGELVVNAIRRSHPECKVLYQPDRTDLVEFLASELKPGDLCISMGCGDIASLPQEVIALRKGKRS